MCLCALFRLDLIVTEEAVDIFANSSLAGVKDPWNLPLLPRVLPDESEMSELMYANTNGKRIPRHLWMAFKDLPEEKDLKDYQRNMFKRNVDANWTLHLADNAGKLAFMEHYYANTSLLWAYRIIHPAVGNSAADIWRYGVLWMLGGLYMDDDSYFESSLDNIIGQNDSLIMAAEKNGYNDDCFEKSYRLSARSMHHRYNRSVSHLFGGRTLVSWAVFAEPRHPIMLRTMSNIVDLIRLEYLRKSEVHMYKFDARWKLCMCTTGPAVLTASARETVLEVDREIKHNSTSSTTDHLPMPLSNVQSILRYKIYKRDFHEYGGVFKVYDNTDNGGKESSHYMHTMQKYNIPLLAQYADLDGSNMHGRLITGDGKELFLVLNGERRGFEDYDTFLAYNFNLRQVAHLSMTLVESIPLNSTRLTVEDARLKNKEDTMKNNDENLFVNY